MGKQVLNLFAVFFQVMASTNDLSRVRADLDGLGLYQPLPPECVPLVETLLHEIRKRDGQIAGSNRQRYSASKKEDMKRKMHVAERKVRIVVFVPNCNSYHM